MANINIQPAMEHFERPDPALTNKIVTYLKSQGIFDQFRRECMADVDTKPAYQNLRQRVEGSVATFLRKNPWRPDMNKNQVRDNLRKHLQSGGFLDIGVDRIVDQVVNPKIYTVFLPKVEEVVQHCLGMENDKPKFDPPPSAMIKSESPHFQDKHNLGAVPAPLMGPKISILRPQFPDKARGRDSPGEGKSANNGGDTDTEEMADKKYVVDDDEPEEKEDEDDEESPPFEHHAEGDRMILGMRSDSSENSNDSQLVTTIVDDSLEERIDNNDTSVKEEHERKDYDSSSDEYVAKSPTTQMEESDEALLEYNSISQYKQYQTKFDENSFGNVEEVVSSHWSNENRELVKEERSSNEEDSLSGMRKRKFNADSYDDASSHSSDNESTSDEIKPAVFKSFTRKRYKPDESVQEVDTSELSFIKAENEDSCTEKSLDSSDLKLKTSDIEFQEKHNKSSSISSKDSGQNHPEDSHYKDYRESLTNKDKSTDDEHLEDPTSSLHLKGSYKKSEKHESSSIQHREEERKKSESASKHSEKGVKHKHHGKERTREKDKKRSHSESNKTEMEDGEKSRKESRHEHKDHHESKSREHSDKEKKRHSSHVRHSDGKRTHDSYHKHEKKDSSKHSHSSSRHKHRSSSEKHSSNKDHKHRESPAKHKSHDKKSAKEKEEESRKKNREQCKTNDKDENRRSSDRDSSGPSSRSYVSSSLKPASSRSQRESKVDSVDKTTSNSDNSVSDNIEPLQSDLKFEAINEQGISSPDTEPVEDFSNNDESVWNSSREDPERLSSGTETNPADSSNEVGEEMMIKSSESEQNSKHVMKSPSLQSQHRTEQLDLENVQRNPEANHFMDSCEDSNSSFQNNNNNKQDSSLPHHDSSSEKENIEQETSKTTNNNLDNTSPDVSLDEDSVVVKFKKPKIAANIFEVKKIMQARRQLKRIEKKRVKLLMKNNTEEFESQEQSPNEDNSRDEFQAEAFRGFEGDFLSTKIEKYDCLIERLSSEVLSLQSLLNHEQINGNLITSWIDINPKLDDYIENTLKGRVHRKYRVRLPPIGDEYYNYDPEQNVFFLVNTVENVSAEKDIMVGSNLNNLNSVTRYEFCDETLQSSSKHIENNKSYIESRSKKKEQSVETLTCTKNTITDESYDVFQEKSPKHKTCCELIDLSSENSESTLENNTSSSVCDATKDVGNKNSNDIIACLGFQLTFNQTYDEVLKEKAQNSVTPSKKEVEENHKTARTVIKITTNNKTSEQFVMKKIQSNAEDRVQVPRITRSESIVNGNILETSPPSKRIPLISRITKTKNVLTPPTAKAKFQCIKGVLSSDSATNLERKLPKAVSLKMINDVIGIQDANPEQGDISDQGSRPGTGEESSDHKQRRVTTGCRQPQRYNNSDLYKPRIQFPRRARAASSSPEAVSPVSEEVTRRKRSATTNLTSASVKRRR